MQIGIDASRVTVGQRTGTEGYSLHLLSNLMQVGEAHSFHLYFRDEPDPHLFAEFSNVAQHIIRQPRIWTHLGLGPYIRRNPIDVLFIPAHVVPWPGTGRTPTVVTIHDLGYLHYPGKHPFFDRVYLDWSTRHSAQAARRVIAVSQATAHDLSALNNVNREKIIVVHSGVAPSMTRNTSPERIQQVRREIGLQGPFILHVGSVQPRKNLVRLVEAFNLIKHVRPGLQLVLAGRKGWGANRLQEQIEQMGLQEHVVLPGYISDDALVPLYNTAEVYAFPSLYEGFGFPALEAMACGTPVVCSNVSSLPELVGDAALTFAPTDTKRMGAVLRKVLTDQSLRQKMIARGFEQASKFTWKRTAAQTLTVLEAAAAL